MAMGFFHWLMLLGNRGVSRKAYYCDANDCLFPKRLEELSYGCSLCPEPHPLFNDLGSEVSQLLPTPLQNVFSGAAPECPKHARFRVVPRCPVCWAPIDRLGHFPPIGIWGSVDVGKTIYCAVLARQIEDRLYRLTGMTVSPGYDRGLYRREVVQPLFSVKGRLPRKTRPHEHRKLVLRFEGNGWPSRKVTFTDMAGEVYSLDPYEMGSDEALARKQRTVLLTEESIFLVNPEGSERLGASARPDLHGVLSSLIALPRIQERLATAEAVEKLARSMKRILEARFFPAPVYSSADGKPFQRLAEDLSSCLEDASLVAEIRECLEAAASVMARAMPFTEQLQKLWRFMDSAGCARVRDKLDHRIAIAVSKSDVLDDRPLGFDEVLESCGVPTNGATSPASREHWRKALREIAARSEQALVDLGEGEFVTWVRRHFTQVGFFFISSLGRATEPFATKVRRRPVPASMRVQASDPSIPRPHSAVELEEPRWEWRLDKRMTTDPAVGSRTPAPDGVLLPLLWLLAEA